MSFGFLGTFRQTQWRCFRQFLLSERRVVNARLAYIDAQIQRIGEITVFYERRGGVTESVEGRLETATQVTERRTGFHVSEGSSLHKLVQAYIAQGGNPCEISLFLRPDHVLWQSDKDPEDDPSVDPTVSLDDEEVPGALNEQPGFGVVAPESDNRGLGGPDKGGWLKWGRYPFRRAGRIIDLSEADQQIAYQVDFARRWANPTIQERRNNLEARIIKLMDYREQLENEREAVLVQALGGTVEGLPLGDPRQFQPDLHTARIVNSIDRILYNSVPVGRTPDEKLQRQIHEVVARPGANRADVTAQELARGIAEMESRRAQEVSSTPGSDFEDMLPDLNSINLESLSKFDTLWADEEDDDRFTAL